MNQDLEALLKAFDSVMEAQNKEESQHGREIYDRKLQEVLQRHPSLSRASLHHAIAKRYPEWSRKQNKPATIPPKA